LSEDSPVPGGVAPGTLVAGYRVEEPLGAGGMAVVYRARDERLGRPVALKVLPPALAADAGFRRRFTAESRAAAAVDHPNIIPVYEAGQAGRSLFIAMRLVAGGDLGGVLSREGPLPPARAAQFLSPIASALDAAHRAGLVHRDVKPGNVLVDTSPGRPEHVYLSDFGISKGAASSAGLTGTGQFLGTPNYTSPEQIKGLAADGRADQYALACVTWQLLTGTVPFERADGMDVLFAHLHEPPPPLDALRPGLPAATGQVLARALAKEPGERYPSCGEFADALRDALGVPPYRPAANLAESWDPRSVAAARSAHPAPAPALQRLHQPGTRLERRRLLRNIPRHHPRRPGDPSTGGLPEEVIVLRTVVTSQHALACRHFHLGRWLFVAHPGTAQARPDDTAPGPRAGTAAVKMTRPTTPPKTRRASMISLAQPSWHEEAPARSWIAHRGVPHTVGCAGRRPGGTSGTGSAAR